MDFTKLLAMLQSESLLLNDNAAESGAERRKHHQQRTGLGFGQRDSFAIAEPNCGKRGRVKLDRSDLGRIDDIVRDLQKAVFHW